MCKKRLEGGLEKYTDKERQGIHAERPDKMNERKKKTLLRIQIRDPVLF
jgi:hypothetical protein